MDQLTNTFSALADPTRRAILARLANGEASVTELAAPFEMSIPAISKHLKVLERAGLIARGREAQWRPCQLEAGPLKEVADWVMGYRSFWEQSPGGVWEFIMHGPDGVDYENRNICAEVRRPERLAYDHVSPPYFDSTVTFEEVDGKTRVTLRSVFETVEEFNRVVKVFRAIEGAEQTLARLAERLALVPKIG